MLKSGEHICPAEIGLLATVGVTTVKVNNVSVSVVELGRDTIEKQHSEFACAGIPSTDHCCIFHRG